MSFFDALRHRVRTILQPGAEQRDRDEEFQFHQALAARDAARDAGSLSATPAARHAARRDFGNATYLSETVRWMGATRWLDVLRQDLRYGVRTLTRSPVFALVAILSIGLGVGANTAVFGILYNVMLERLPLPRAHELVMLDRAGVQFGYFFSREQSESIAHSPDVHVTAVSTTFAENTEISGSRLVLDGIDLVDSAYYPTLELSPAAGRLLSAADHATAAPVAVTSFRFAVRHFGSAAAAVGKTITMNGSPFTIVGVTPKAYAGLMLVRPSEVVVPHSARGLIQPLRPGGRGSAPYLIIARVPEGGSQEVAAITGAFQQCCADGQLRSETTDNTPGQRAILTDISRGISAGKIDVRARYGQTLYALMGGVALLLLIACTNVGNLLLARAVVRSRELAVRLSLGASRSRIVRQLFVESALIALAGAAVGILVAVFGTALLARNLPANLTIFGDFVAIAPTAPILAFTGIVAIGCVLLFGVLPALRATRFDLITQLRELRPGASGLGRLDRAIVAIQVGLALVLASGAGLLVATLRNLSSGTRTLEPDRLLIVEVDLRGGPHANRDVRVLQQDLAREFRRVPGVQSVAGTTLMPLLFMGGAARVVDIKGYESLPEREMSVGLAHVEPGFFETMSITLRGRDFTAQDTRGAEPVVIVSQSIADRFFAGRDPVGEMISWRRGANDPPAPAFRIVGVAEDVKYFDLRAAAPRELYFPFEQETDLASQFGMRPLFAIRTAGPAAAVAPATRRILDAMLPGVRIRRNQPMTEAASGLLGREQALATLSLIFGGLAVSLAAIGLYGVLAFHVSTRRREIGVRIALGAGAADVVRMVIVQSLVVVVVGAIIGIPLSLMAARSMGALLYGITPWNPLPIAAAALVLLATGVLASLLPSRSAARVDPLVAMRAE